VNALLACAPILVVGVGALLLMLAEAFGRPVADASSGGEAVLDAGAGRSAELALGSAVALFAGALTSLGLWWVGPERLEGVADLAPYLAMDRFTLFFCFTLCLGGGLAALFAGAYLPEHGIDRSEFFPLPSCSRPWAPWRSRRPRTCSRCSSRSKPCRSASTA
jgi:NADH-quinone oxidoreductase subunit N